ncbi:MAG: aldehyde dehydrogenase family protein [Rhodothermales bacterium]|nr:aldehyde dehydrogenase family protein [Rhodothermales bacterium]
MVSSEILTDVDVSVLRSAFERQQSHQYRVASTSAAERISKLGVLRKAILSRRELIREALFADFRKPPEEVDLTEIIPLLLEIRHAQRNVAKWMRPLKVPTSLPLLGTTSEVRSEPKGVVLLISPWNYPWMLTLGPLVSAIAAGNCAILKPSEHTPNTSRLIAEMIADTFSPAEVTVFNGDRHVATALLELPFNHVFFTGSPAIGSVVMEAAARNLSSVTLELGGKSPAIVDDSADLEAAALAIMWGKYANAGQTCVAPDFALVPDTIHAEFVSALIDAEQRLRDGGDLSSAGYARLVSEKHAARVSALVVNAVEDGAECAVGGSGSPSERYIPPTVLTGVKWDSRIMSEEIFGPVLPVLTYSSADEVVERMRATPIPLSLYVFAADPAVADFWIENTRSGGIVINDVAIHFGNPDLPFGGMQNSGIGRSHGHAGFKAFSDERAVMRQRLGNPPIRRFYPPYGPMTQRFIDWLMRFAG